MRPPLLKHILGTTTHTHLWHTEQDSFQRCGVHMRASGIKTTLSSNSAGVEWSGGAVLVGTGRDEVGRGVRDKQQTGRGLHRQLEGIRVSDRDLSDAAVAVAD